MNGIDVGVDGAGVDVGIVYGELFTPELARQQHEQALDLAKELRSQYWIHHVIGGLASAYILLGDLVQAEACLEKVLAPETPMDTMGKRYCWVRRAELALAQGDPALALGIIDQLISTAPGMVTDSVITFLWQLKGEALAALGQTEEARALLRAALENAQANEERFLLWRVHASLGRLYEAAGQQTEAREEFSDAGDLVAQLADSIDDEVLRERFLEGAKRVLRKPVG